MHNFAGAVVVYIILNTKFMLEIMNDFAKNMTRRRRRQRMFMVVVAASKPHASMNKEHNDKTEKKTREMNI